MEYSNWLTMSLRVPICRSPRYSAEARSRVGISLKEIWAMSAAKSPSSTVSRSR